MGQAQALPSVGARDALLELQGVTKRFGGTTALRGVDFSLAEGEVHAIVGENGAGKSTLMKIFAGVHSGFEGHMYLKGKPVHFRSPADATRHGIGMIHQELSVIRALSVAENLFLGRQPLTAYGTVDWRRMRAEAERELRQFNLDIDVRAPMSRYSLGIQQMVEIVRTVFSGANIIIMDEPTSALSTRESEELLGFINQLRSSGKSILFISHILDDVLRIADRVTVMRDGQRQATLSRDEVTKEQIIRLMLGKDLDSSLYGEGVVHLPARAEAPTMLAARGFTARGTFENLNFEVRKGEILGLYGFMGAGHLDVLRALFGVSPLTAGEVLVEGRPAHIRSSTQAARLGLSYVPEARKSTLFLTKNIAQNISLPNLRLAGWRLSQRRESDVGAKWTTAAGVHPNDIRYLVRNLSGGNQQKVAVAKWLPGNPRVLLLAEPTRGMDVGAKDEVARLIRGLKDKGMAVVVASSEPETIMGLCDRILVMSKGQIVKEFQGGPVSKDALFHSA